MSVEVSWRHLTQPSPGAKYVPFSFQFDVRNGMSAFCLAKIWQELATGEFEQMFQSQNLRASFE